MSRAKLAAARKNTRRKPSRKKRKKRTKRAPWKRRALMAALVVLGVAVGVGATAMFGFRWFRDRPAPRLKQGESVAVSWPDGLDAAEAAALLVDLGLSDNAPAMELYLRVADRVACIIPGPHLLPTGVTPHQLGAALCRDPDRTRVRVTVPEGFNRYAIAKRLENLGVVSADAFLLSSGESELLFRLGIEPAPLPVASTAEGYLFPATYQMPVDCAPAEVVSLFVKEADRRWQRAIAAHPGGWERVQAELELDRRGVITLASMVEKEAVVAEERPVIASVFLNRLRDPSFRHLQSDPTSIYGCYAMADEIAACKDFDGKPSGAINRDPHNVYSTYVTAGLPPGPVANPGSASIEAVLDPADTSFFYFVARGAGRHTFSESYDDHNRAVRQLRELRAQ